MYKQKSFNNVNVLYPILDGNVSYISCSAGPWSRKRHSSASIPSRERSETSSKAQEESLPAGATCNLTFGNNAHDSGIVPDSVEALEKTAGSKGSWRFNQGFDTADISVGQDKLSKKLGLQSKKISFKDELDFHNSHCRESCLSAKERKTRLYSRECRA